MHTYSKPHSTQKTLHIGVVGARGYSGQELCRALLHHPRVTHLTLGLNENQLSLPHWLPEAPSFSDSLLWPGSSTKQIHTLNMKTFLETAASQLDFVFLATPAEVSLELVPQLHQAQVPVIDLSGAFRLKNPKDYEIWYGFEHTHPELLKIAQYGLCPFNQSIFAIPPKGPAIPLIANPGCYATALQMALIPLLQGRCLKSESLVIDAKSGTTGAGRKASEAQLFAEVDGDCLPYKVGRHQHLPEVIEHIHHWTQTEIAPFFSTSLLPVRRGITAGIYASLEPGFDADDLMALYQKAFADYPLVRVSPLETPLGDSLRSLKRVVGSARTHIVFSVQGSKLYLYTFIDNLMKGAATQAIENMNYLSGWPLETGLLHREGLI